MKVFWWSFAAIAATLLLFSPLSFIGVLILALVSLMLLPIVLISAPLIFLTCIVGAPLLIGALLLWLIPSLMFGTLLFIMLPVIVFMAIASLLFVPFCAV